MENLITPVQTGISGRYIGETIRTMADLLCHAKVTSTPLGALLLDQEKAFDKVSHQFLQRVLEKMGFGSNFRKWIRLLYTDAQSKIKINSFVGDSFTLNRGVRQGDCLSPNLFVICLEPFLQAIITDDNIQGYNLADGTCIKVVAYADDTTPVTSRSEDIPHLEHWMSMYEQATGATFSRSKSELVLYNMTPPSATDFFPRIVTDPHFTFKFLGVPLSFHQNQDERWTGPLTKYQTCLKMWTRAGLSLQGKLVVLKHFAYPILTYQAQSVHVNKDVIEELESDAWKFFWGKKRGRVNYETTRLPKDNGGYGYSTFKDLLHKLQARWTIRLLQQWTSGKPWVALAKWMIAQVNSKWGHGLSTLYVQGGRHAAEKCPSPFWGACLKGFWRLNQHYELTQTQESALLARSMPLFHNPAIQHHQKPLNGSRWQTFTQVGIRRICDLIFHDHIGSYDEIVAYYGHLPRPAVTDLLAALPATLTDIATTTAALTPDTEWAHTTNTGHRAYSVTENPLRGGPYLPHAHCWDMDNLEDPEPDYLGIRPVADILELRPARLTFDVEGQIRLAYCDNMEIDVNQLTYGPPPPITGTPKNEEEWTRSLFPPP